MPRHALPCFKCGKELINSDPRYENEPLLGVSFSAEGTVGSSVWNNHDDEKNPGEKLEISICDMCLIRAADRGWVFSFAEEPRKLRQVPWAGIPEDQRDHTYRENEIRYGAVGEDSTYTPAYDDVDDGEADAREGLHTAHELLDS